MTTLGGGGATRTPDLGIMRPSLYRLSYTAIWSKCSKSRRLARAHPRQGVASYKLWKIGANPRDRAAGSPPVCGRISEVACNCHGNKRLHELLPRGSK